MSNVLLVAALICAVIAACMGFDVVIHDPSDLFGWLSASIALYLASEMVERY